MALSSRVRTRLLLVVLLALVGWSSAPAAHAELDFKAPVLVSAARTSPDVIDAGTTVSIHYSAFDEGLGLANLDFEFTGPLGNRFDAYSLWNPANEGVAVGTLPAWAPSGVYKLRVVELRDKGDLFSTYYPSGYVSRTTYQSEGDGRHTLDLTALNFTVVNLNTDAAQPFLLSVSRATPATAVPGDTVRLDLEVADLGSGVDRAYFRYSGPMGQLWNLGASYFPTQGEQATWRISARSPGGFYKLMEVEVSDKSGNRITYFRDGKVRPENGALAPPTHLVDFSAADVTIVNENGDSELPVLQSVKRVSPEVAKPGDVVSIDFTVSEPGWMSMWWDGPLGKTLISSDSGYWPLDQVHVRIPASAPSGTYKLRMAYAEDYAGYTVEYYRGGSITNRNPEAWPKSTHTVDFAPADFIVDNGPLPATTTTSTSTTTTAPTTTTTTVPPTTTTTPPSTTTTTTTTPPVLNKAPTAKGRVAKLSNPAHTLVVDGDVSTDTDGSVAHYMWLWGDGSRSFGRRAWHTYAKAGTYLVRLVIVDNDGAAATAAAWVRVP